MTAAILGGHVDLVSNWVRPMIPHLAEGKLKLLGYAAFERHPDYPDVPTLRELGYDIVIEFPYGMGGPKGLPENVKTKLTAALQYAWKQSQLQEDLDKRALTVFRKKGEAFRQHLHNMQRDVSRAVELVRSEAQ